MNLHANKAMEACAYACHECEDACLACIIHCLDLGGEHASLNHQTSLTDCAAMCGVTHGFLHRQSPHAKHLCTECAEICRACADDCETLGTGDATMEACVEACRRCATACERIRIRNPAI